MSLQRYVSDELTHFVGRSYRSQYNAHERQYELLVSILREGLLGKGPSDAPAPDPDQRLSQNDYYKGTVVCFSDIPVPDLGIHMGKFSRFGLAFTKSFLIAKGANPVFYVARNSFCAAGEDADQSRAQAFDHRHAQFRRVFDRMRAGAGDPACQGEEAAQLWDFLAVQLFSYVKFYDEGLPPEDERNYYMEREWRAPGLLQFSLDDVRRVIFPQRFAKSFRADVPDYYGEITFS